MSEGPEVSLVWFVEWRGDIHAVMAGVNHIVCVIPPVMVPEVCQEPLSNDASLDALPVECQGITWHDLDRVCSLNVAHDIAPKVYRVQVLDWRIVITTFARWAVVRGCANAPGCALIDAIDIDSLPNVSQRRVEIWAAQTQMKVCAAAWLARSATAMAKERAMVSE
jgi:hypothetical protein